MRKGTANILSFLENFTLPLAEDIGKHIAGDFRKRRIEKGVSREEIANRADVPLSNVARFEQKGLISLTNLIRLAVALDYTAEIKGVFSEPKFSTMEELTQIRKNTGKKNAFTKQKNIAVGTKIKMDADRCRAIIEEVKNGCGPLERYTIKG